MKIAQLKTEAAKRIRSELEFALGELHDLNQVWVDLEEMAEGGESTSKEVRIATKEGFKYAWATAFPEDFEWSEIED